MAFISLSSCLITMYHKRSLHLVHSQTTGQVINHLLVVTMSGEAFNLCDLGFDPSVQTEDRNPLQAGLLNTCTT